MSDHEAGRLHRLLHDCAPQAPVHGDTATRARARAHRMRRNRRAGVASVLTAALVAVGVPVGLHLAPQDSARQVAGPGPVTNCHVTQPLPRAKVPTTLRGLGDRWVGADDLWIELPAGAVSAGSTRLKYGTFTLDDRGRLSDAEGAPTLTAQRLDGTGSAKGDPPSYSSAAGPRDQTIHFWPTTITLPRSGCWQLTAKLKDTAVSFVVDLRHQQRETAQDLAPVLALPRHANDRLPRALRENARGLDVSSSRLLGTSRYGKHWVVRGDRGKVCLVTRLTAGKKDGAGDATGTSGAACTTPQTFRRQGLTLTVGGHSAQGAATYLLPAGVDAGSVHAAVNRLNQDPGANAVVVERDSTFALVYSRAASPDGDVTIARTDDQPGPAFRVPNP